MRSIHQALSGRGWATFLLGLLALAASAAFAEEAEDADGGYRRLLESWKAKEWSKALELAERFTSDHADYKYAAGALYIGGDAGLKCGEYLRAEPFFRRLLDRFPKYKKARAARDELVSALSYARRLEACMAQCEKNLAEDPDAPQRFRWKFTRAECLFRMWRFEEAKKALEAFLAEDPPSSLVERARESLGRIEPPWKVDSTGVAGGYAGKYADDPRFKAALEELPGLVERSYRTLKERLACDLRGKAGIIFRFEDAGDSGRGGTRGRAFTVCREGRPETVILFYTEYVVLSRKDFEGRMAHEIEHAAFRGLLGTRYLEFPRWVREGLAVWGSGQLADRVFSVLSNAVFSGGDPFALLDGITTGRNLDDYMEDALAMEWLERRGKGSVGEFCRLMVAGEDPEAAFAKAAGLPAAEAMKTADAWCRERVEELLGDGWREYKAIRDAAFDAQAGGGDALAAWLKKEGEDAFESWLTRHPGHPLAPNARYRLGKFLVIAGRPEEGRKILRPIVENDFLRCSICDDASYWMARALEDEGKAEEALEAYGVLLRDYSWSKAAAKARKEGKGPK